MEVSLNRQSCRTWGGCGLVMPRRGFLSGIGAAALMGPLDKASPLFAAPLEESGGVVRARGAHYTWEWSPSTDEFHLLDGRGRTVTFGPLQPLVMVQAVGTKQLRCSAGQVAGKKFSAGRLEVTYQGVNGGGTLRVVWRFDDGGCWQDPILYENSAAADIVEVRYFAKVVGDFASPALGNNYLVFPGISMGSALSPIIPPAMRLNMVGWLGHGGPLDKPGLFQQWGLPCHFFGGVHHGPADWPFTTKGAMRDFLSEAFCCGLADLPAASLLLETRDGRHSLIFEYRGDLWGHLRTPGRFTLGATLCWTVAGDYREAIRAYYLALVRAGIVSPKKNSAAKNAAALAPQFNTWGAEVVAGKSSARFDENFLLDLYGRLKASGMKPGMLVLDDKWEGHYGRLEHSTERFPHFEQFLARVRQDGLRVGLWAAFLRCQDPAEFGLSLDHMLRSADGTPNRRGGSDGYYMFDVSQPKVQEVLRGLAKRFIRRYQPDLVKFDFGYELPGLSAGAPRDMQWAGERLLQKGIEVVVGAMKEERPDLVVMYYSLSPLFAAHIDLHSPDDLWVCAVEYDLEANRRFFFSSLLGELGIPTYGSGGYDWATVPEIWFDSAAIGTLGSLNSFTPDEQNETPSPRQLAKYNGLAQILRASNVFTVQPLERPSLGPTRGARSSSWVRLEEGEVVMLALRAHGFDGTAGNLRYGDSIVSTASVVVASKSRDSITRASRLGMVPYGTGELTLRREDHAATHAAVTEHLFGGGTVVNQAQVRDGVIRLDLRENTVDGTPIEWIEIGLERSY